MGRLILSLLFCSLLCGLSRSFSFTLNNQPSQCDALSVSWTGGQPPFRLIGVIPNGTDFNVTIPDSNFQNNKGSYTLPALPVPKSKQIFFAMSDATGPVSGGATDLMLVGDTTSGQTCNTTDHGNDFYFSADSTLTQCGNFPFTLYDGAILPLTIFAWLPNSSNSFVLPFNPPSATSYTWKANITAQTEVVFSVIDSQGRRGGTDDVRRVAPSSDSSCLQSTSGNNGSGGIGGNGSGGGGNGKDSGSQKKTSGLSTGAIVGIAVGGGVGFMLLAILLWCLTRRKKSDVYGRKDVDLAEDFARHPELSQPMLAAQQYIDPYPPVFAPPGATNDSVSSFRPDKAYMQQQYPYGQPPPGIGVPVPVPVPAPAPSTSGSSGYYDSGTASTSGQATLASTSSSRQTKFVVHRDIEEVETPVDLPPQYVDRRPISEFGDQSAPPLPPNGRRPKKG